MCSTLYVMAYLLFIQWWHHLNTHINCHFTADNFATLSNEMGISENQTPHMCTIGMLKITWNKMYYSQIQMKKFLAKCLTPAVDWLCSWCEAADWSTEPKFKFFRVCQLEIDPSWLNSSVHNLSKTCKLKSFKHFKQKKTCEYLI